MSTRRGAEHAANVLEALIESQRPLSAYELLDQLRPTGVAAPLTIYRALEKLMESGKVHRIESLNAFVACAGHDHAQGGAHVHAPERPVGFAICDSCGSVAEFENPQISERVRDDLSSRAFKPRTSALEVHGLCGACDARTR